MWPPFIDAALTSPFGWLLIPLLFLIAFAVTAVIERRQARVLACRDRHPSKARSRAAR